MTSTNQIIAHAITKAVAETVRRSDVAAQPSSISPIVAAVLSETGPIIENKTNQEPWYQSRVTWGAIVSGVLPLLAVVGVSADVIKVDELAVILAAAGTVGGSLYTLYGRWRAKKALGK